MAQRFLEYLDLIPDTLGCSEGGSLIKTWLNTGALIKPYALNHCNYLDGTLVM